MSAHTPTPFPRLVLVEEPTGALRIASEQVANNPGSKNWIATVKHGDERAERMALRMIRGSNAYDELVAALRALLVCMNLAGWEGHAMAEQARAALAKAEVTS